MYRYSNLARPHRGKLSIYLRTSIKLFFCTLLLIGIIPPSLITHITPAPFAPLAEAAAGLLPEPNVALAQSCPSGADDLGGLVWNDDNTDGTRSGPTEIGVDGTGTMTVEAHDRNGLVATATVGITGIYVFDDLFSGRTDDDKKFRLEFIGLPTNYAYSIHGDDNGTATQFHDAGTCDADLGIHIPPKLCEADDNALVRTYGIVMTCGADETTDVVMALKDISGLSYNTATQTPTVFTTTAWTLGNIGNIYFTEFDDVGNIYGTASAFTQQNEWASTNNALKQYGALGGSGAIYKFDAVTGAATVFATLNQGGAVSSNDDPGLGGITYDEATNSMYVVNMFDNTIYQFNATTGVTLTTYKPDPAVLGSASVTTSSQDQKTISDSITKTFQAVPFGVDVYGGRLYYTVHDATGGGSLVVRSVALDATSGAMDGATDREDINQVIPIAIKASVTFTHTNAHESDLLADPVVADIDFSPSGQMAVGTFSSGPTVSSEDFDSMNISGGSTAEKSYYLHGDTNSIYNHVGLNYIFEPDGSGGWTQTAMTSVGQMTHDLFNTNSTATGGVAWSLDSSNPETLWMSGGDFTTENNSKWGIIGYDSTQLTNAHSQENARDYIQFLFGDQSTPDPKGNGGDVDVFSCETPLMEIGNYLWLDNNNDGIQDPDEPGVPNIALVLTDSNGVTTTITSGSNGEYYLSVKPSTQYTLTIDTSQPALEDVVLTWPSENGSDTKTFITRGVGESDHTYNFGFTPNVTIGSTLFYDYNDNGFQDTNEPGIPDVRVELYDDLNNRQAFRITDSNGDYYFDGLFADGYQIKIPTPPADAPTSSTPTDTADNQEDGDDNGIQLGGPGTVVSSPVISLTVDGEPVGETEQGGTQDDSDDDNGDMTIDFGFVPYVSLGSTLFYDPNNNGIQDSGEGGISGIVVELRDITGTVIISTTTITNGAYLFEQLLVGDYQVAIPNPPTDAPNSSTPTSITDDNVDSNDDGSQPDGAGGEVLSPVINLFLNKEPTGETGRGGTQDAADDNNGNMTIDFGFVPAVSIGSTLFYDPDDSGTQDVGEDGIPDIVVELRNITETVLITDTTDENGDYFFGDLLPGDYQVVIPAPPADAPTSSTPTDSADNQEDGDDNGNQPSGSGGAVSSPVITLGVDEEPTDGGTETAQGNGQDSSDDDNGDMTIDFGFIPYVSLGSTLFYDNDNSGTQDNGEPGVFNILVELRNITGTVVATTTTDTNGNYFFDDLFPGDYQVAVPTPPADAPTSSTPTGTTDDDVDGDDNGAQPDGPGGEAISPVITLTHNGEPENELGQGGNHDVADDDNGNMTIDFGFVSYVSIGSTLFYDPNDSGTQDAGEIGIPDIVVELRAVDGTLLMTDTTDASGDYYFGDLLPDDYQVAIPTPPADAPTSSTPTDGTDNQEDGDDNGNQPTGSGGEVLSPVITLVVDDEPTDATETAQGNAQDVGDDNNGDMTIDFGFVPYVSLGSTLFYDDNNNGIQDNGEPGIPGITVALQDDSGNPIATTTTDANGNYLFNKLLAGAYQVVVPTPPGDAPTSSTPTSTTDDNVDGDDNGIQANSGAPATSPVVTLSVNGEPTGESGQGGTQDGADDNNGNMTVDFGFVRHVSIGSTLFYDPNDNGFQDAGEAGISGITVQLRDTNGNVVATTTTNGNGDYYFGGLLAGNYQVVIPTPPGDAPTSSTPTDLADNQQDGDDNGNQPGGSGGVVTSPVITLAINAEPTDAGTEGAQGNGQDSSDDNNGDMTIDFGFIPYVSLGSTLFYDNDNGGTQDVGEAGIPNIAVELYDTAGNLMVTTTTNISGNYLFDNLLPGDYQVVVPTPPADAPTSSTPTSTDDDDVDGDDNGAQPSVGDPATSPIITLSPNSEPTGESGQGGDQDAADDNNGNMTVDFGFVPYVSIGSTLFYDDNDNGMQDVGEAAIPSIIVELHDTNGNIVATTTTDTNGDYLFDKLLPGDYQVVVPTPPADAPTSSTPTDTADNQEDSDDNGHQPTGAGGAVTSPMITLKPNGEPVSESGQGGTQDATDDDNGDMTIDFGFIRHISIGSTLFYDDNDNGFQDAVESGIPGLVVELHDTAGNVLASTTTDANGDYYFGGLLAGDYQVVVPTPPSDAPTSSTSTDMADNQEDGDDNGHQPSGSGGVVTSPVITLTPNEEPVGESGQGGDQDAADDNNGDMTVDFGFVRHVSIGSTLFYDDNDNGFQDADDPGIADLVVELHDTAGNVLASNTTDGNGDYYFGGLLPGDYQVVVPTPPTDAPTSSTSTDMADNQEDGDDNGDQPDGPGGASISPVINLAVDDEPTDDGTETEQGNGQDSSDDDNGDMTIDFGFIRYVSLGSTLFYDPDDNGIQDAGESGIPGIVVELRDPAGNVITTTTTDGDGNYFFGELLEGNYQVIIPSPPTDAFTSSTPANLLDDDVDGDDNGNQPNGPGGPVSSPIITLTVDGEPTDEPNQGGGQDAADDDNGNMTIDFGFIPNSEPIVEPTIRPTARPTVEPTVEPTIRPTARPTVQPTVEPTVDSGLIPEVSVGSTVFYDPNDNGIQDAGELGIPGVVLELRDAQGNVLGQTTTDGDGNYFFDELPPGDYQIVIPAPPADAPVSSTTTNHVDDSTDSDDNGDQPDGLGGPVSSPIVTLALDSELSGETAQGGDQDATDDNNGDMTVDFGFVPLVSIGSTVFYDPNDNGFQDAGEGGISNVLLALYDAAGNFVGTDRTDENGDYYFGELLPGDYQIVIEAPPADAPDSSTPTDSADNQEDGDDNGNQLGGAGTRVTSPMITLTVDGEPTGETEQGGDQDATDDNNGDMTIDFGFVPEPDRLSIGSTVFYDPDDSGTQDSGEAGIPGIIVELRDSDGVLVATDTTDANGDYYFGGLEPGDYQVVIPNPPADAPDSSTPTDTADNQEDGDDNGDQPDGTGTAVLSPMITLTAGEEPTEEPAQGGDQDAASDENGDMTIDFGFVPEPDRLSIGSTVYYDPNNNGMQDPDEAGISNIVVELYDENGNLVATDSTDANGDYYFNDLDEGTYQVVIPNPPADAPISSTPTDAADNQEDGDDNGDQPDGSGTRVTSPMISLTAGEEPTGEPAQGGDQDAASDSNGDMTIDFGFISLVSVGSTVFYDDNDNGIQDPGEAGIPGVLVELHDAAGNLIAADRTDENGDYYFGELLPGDYQVVIEAPPVDAPDSSTSTDSADNQEDGDDNGDQPGGTGTQVTSPVITLTVDDEPTGETEQGGDQDVADDNNGDMTIDLGFVPTTELVSLGSTVFYDPDDSGTQDPGEAGIPDITVELRDSNGILIATDTTDRNGDYYFSDLSPGDYQVVIPTPPADAPDSSTPTDIMDNQEDGDDNGDQPGGSGTRVTSPMITLTAGDEPTEEPAQGGDQDDVSDSNGDMTIDFGFVPEPDRLSIGSTVYYDPNDNGMQDADEAGISTIVVELYDENGNLVATATTDANGDYYFDGLDEGTYQVVIPNPPADAPMSSTPTDRADNQEDGDDNGDQPDGTGTAVLSPMITLTLGNEPAGEPAQGGNQDAASDSNGDMTIDFGFVIDNSLVSVGSTVFYDPNDNGLQEPDEGGIPDVVIELHDVEGNVIITNTTDSEGDNVFNGLEPGYYLIVIPEPPSDAPTSSTPTDMEDNQEDGDDNGDQPDGPGGIVTSPIITLTVDGEPTNEPNTEPDLGDDDNRDTTIDFGFVPDANLVSLGSTLFYDPDDSGTQELDEAGIPGIVVELHDSNGNVVVTDTTDPNGDYYFGSLQPGDYQVVIPNPPADAPTSSTPTDMDDNQEDGDDNGDQPDGSGGAVMSPMITLTPDGEPSGEPAQGGSQDSDDDDNGDMTVDFGFVPFVSVGSTLFYDPDDSGTQDEGEAGIPGIAVELHDLDGNVVATTTTDENGDYYFGELLAGDYQIVIPTPPADATMSSTPTDMADNQEDGDDNGDQPDGPGGAVLSPIVTLRVNDEPIGEAEQGGDQDAADDNNGDMTVDFGFVSTVSIGSTLFYDLNDNGLQDEDEAGISGITVALHDVDGNMIASTTTDENGDYYFDGLLPGDYQVVIPTPPADAPISSTPTDMADNQEDGDDNGDQPDGSGGAVMSPIITLVVDGEPTGESEQGGNQDGADDNNGDMTVDFGFITPVTVGSMSNLIWLDINGNGLLDAGENGIPNVTIFLNRGSEVVSETTTNADGSYSFDGLTEGEYYITFTPPEATIPTVDVDDTNLDLVRGPDITIEGSGNVSALDIGLTQLAVLGDYVWFDINRDGVADDDETGFEGVVVHLLDGDGDLVDTTATDSDGFYEFTVPAGDYQIEFIPPQGTELTISEQGEDDTDSDADEETGLTEVVTLPVNTSDLDIDAGLVAVPTAIRLTSLTATENLAGVTVRWRFRSDATTFGFEVYRSSDGIFENAVAVTNDMILTNNNDEVYAFTDTTVAIGELYTYWLVETWGNQQTAHYGPVGVVVEGSQMVFLPIVQR